MTYKEYKETCLKAGLVFKHNDIDTDKSFYDFAAILPDNEGSIIARFKKCNLMSYTSVIHLKPTDTGVAVFKFLGNKNTVIAGEPMLRMIEQSKCEIKKEKIKKKLKEMEKDF
jgi:hypothetical protein